MKTVRVMVASQSGDLIRGLRRLLDADRRIEVVATARSGEECERMAQIVKPHILVSDLHFADKDAGLVIRRLSRVGLQTAVLICSPDAVKGSPPLEDAVGAGAFDFVLCPADEKDLPTVGRQILTQIFVAAFSKTKQIPQGASGPEESAGEPGYKIDGILFDCAAGRIQEAGDLIGLLRPRGKPMILVVLRGAPPAAADFAQVLQGLAGRMQIGLARVEESLVPGWILVMDQTDHGVAVAREKEGGRVKLRRVQDAAAGKEPGPAAVGLYESFARTYGRRGIIVLLGLPRADALHGLVAARAHGSHSIIEKESRSALQDVRLYHADAAIPDGIFTVEQIQGLINGILRVGP